MRRCTLDLTPEERKLGFAGMDQTYVANLLPGSATSKLRAGRRRRSPGSTA